MKCALSSLFLLFVVIACGGNQNGDDLDAQRTADAGGDGAPDAADDAPPGIEREVIRIVDTSSGVDACATDAPGVDLVGVTLATSDGTHKGAANVLVNEIVTGGNGYATPGSLEGIEPDDPCPDRTDATTASLGCGGAVTLEFLDPGRTRVGFQNGDVIHVHEYDAACGDQAGGAESWEFRICSDAQTAASGDATSCDFVLATGESSKDVSVTGL